MKFIAAIAALAIFLAAPAWSSSCAVRGVVIDRLQSAYGESQVGRGLQEQDGNPVMLEVWASHETGSFTVILTNPRGVSCVVAAGTDWILHEAPEQPSGEDM